MVAKLNEQEPKRHWDKTLSEAERIQLIAQEFPSLQNLDCVKVWDAKALEACAGVASHGQRCAIQFVLGVWNQNYEWTCGKFDVIEAIGVWDYDHRKAFCTWLFVPIWL